MRTIKFRAWVTNRDGVTYSNGDHMEYDVTIQDGKYADVESGWDIHGTYDCPLMQYTGMKDKNGKEIYEGDIVKILGAGKSFVFYQDGSFLVRFPEENTLLWSVICEVIGNIYENPELLK